MCLYSIVELTEEHRRLLQWMVDLEDRGSEWPDLNRISRGSGIVSGKCEVLLGELIEGDLVADHDHVDSVVRYAITREGRVRLFADP